ncbi:MAG: hypothetical protein AAGG01_10470, partial [Planctomycetota bacterium]
MPVLSVSALFASLLYAGPSVLDGEVLPIVIEDPFEEEEGVIDQPPPKAKPGEGDQDSGESGNDDGGGGDGGAGEDEEPADDDGANEEGQGEDGDDESGQGDECGDPPGGGGGGGGGPSSPGTSGGPMRPSAGGPAPLRGSALGATQSGGFLVKPGGRPPLLHSGQVNHICEDLYLPGIDPGSDLRILRRHLGRKPDDDSTFGPAWAFNFDHKFVIEGSSQQKLLIEGYGRVDRFIRSATSTAADPVWLGEFGRFDVATIEDKTLVLRRRGGQQFVFDMLVTTDSSNQVIRREGRLREIISTSGNRLRLEYDDPDPRTHVIEALRDAYNRKVSLFLKHHNALALHFALAILGPAALGMLRD